MNHYLSGQMGSSSLTSLPSDVLWRVFKAKGLTVLRVMHQDVFLACKLLRDTRHQHARAASAYGNGITDLSPLSSLSSLQALICIDCNGISDLSPLSSLSSLQTLNCSNCSSIMDLSPLSSLSSLPALTCISLLYPSPSPLD